MLQEQAPAPSHPQLNLQSPPQSNIHQSLQKPQDHGINVGMRYRRGKAVQGFGQKCSWCASKSRIVLHCANKIDELGFIIGCPRCNHHHDYDDCKHAKNATDEERIYYLIECRDGKPLFKTSTDIRLLPGFVEAVNKWRPLTPAFAIQLHKQGHFNKSDPGVCGNFADDPVWGSIDSIVAIKACRILTIYLVTYDISLLESIHISKRDLQRHIEANIHLLIRYSERSRTKV